MALSNNKSLELTLWRRVRFTWASQDAVGLRNAMLAGTAVFGGLAWWAASVGQPRLAAALGLLACVVALMLGALLRSAWVAAPVFAAAHLVRARDRAVEAGGSVDERRALHARWEDMAAPQPAVNIDGSPMVGAVDIYGRAYGMVDSGAPIHASADGGFVSPGSEYTAPHGVDHH